MYRVALSDEQATARGAMCKFLAAPGKQSFTLHGLAGSGKTTVLATIAQEYPSAILCTLTGKAASVLRDKTGLPACTVHSAFYRLEEVKRRNGKQVMNWSTTHSSGALGGEVVLLDECSMIDEGIAADLLRTGAKVVACGDPGQLPPVKGKSFFNTPNATLLTIHRQALESPIIRQAHHVREAGKYSADGGKFRVTSFANDDDLLAADVVLTWRHQTRKAANIECRRLRSLWLPNPQAGEPVMCLKNNASLGVFNGGVHTLAETFRAGDNVINLIVDGKVVGVRNAYFEGLPSDLRDSPDSTGFDFGYAMTVHKAQGSEWKNVILIDEFRGAQEDRRKWLYTGITRAAEQLLVVA